MGPRPILLLFLFLFMAAMAAGPGGWDYPPGMSEANRPLYDACMAREVAKLNNGELSLSIVPSPLILPILVGYTLCLKNDWFYISAIQLAPRLQFLPLFSVSYSRTPRLRRRRLG